MKNYTYLAGMLAGVSAFASLTPAIAADAVSAPQAANKTDSADIVVTATRRKERLQDVPLAVSALSGQALASTGFKSLTDIGYAFSGVQHGDSPNDAGYRVRGVGQLGGFTSSSEAPVGLVVDNVVIGFGSPVESLGDIERVEVLKGPQGTQFGKNASSGVINISTARPDLAKLGANFFASYGDLNERDIHGAINVPLSNKAALNVYAFDKGNDGYIYNSVLKKNWGGGESYGGRVKLLVEPTDNFTVYVIGDYSKRIQEGPGQLWTINKLVASDTAPFGPFGFPFVNLAALGVTPGPNNNVSIEDGDTHYAIENYGASLQMDLKLGGHTLTSVSAFRGSQEAPYTFAIDGAPYQKFFAKAKGAGERFYSEELRLTSPSGHALEYIAGVYFSRRESGLGGGQSAILNPALPYNAFPTISITNGYSITRTNTDSQAAFVDGKFHVGKQFSILAGARLTHDSVTSTFHSVTDPALAPFVPPMPSNGFTPSGTVPYTLSALQTGHTSKTDISGKFGFEYKPTRDLLFFATYARGYLGPTVTFSGLTGTRSDVKPQTVDDVTVGAKMQFLNRTLTVNINGFYDKYKDLQTSVFNGIEFLTENAGGAEVKGFELELVARPIRHFSANASFTYSDAKFTDYITSCPNPIVLAGTQATFCNAPGSVAGTPLYQAAGQSLPGAPRYSIVLGVNFDQPITDTLKFDFASNLSFKSKTQNSVGDANTIQPDYAIVNLNAGIGRSDGKWRLGVFARNLFNENFNSAILGLPFQSTGDYVNWRTREARRTLGVSIQGKF